MSDNVDKKIQASKVEAVAELRKEFENVNDFIFTDYRGLSVEQITALRRELRKENAVFKVVKNRFAKIALEELGREDVSDHLKGPTAIALPHGEAGPVAKMLIEFAKDAPLEIKGGLLNGNMYDVEGVEAFSKLPTRMELLSSLAGTLQAPIQNFVFVLNAVPTKFVRTLQAVADDKN